MSERKRSSGLWFATIVAILILGLGVEAAILLRARPTTRMPYAKGGFQPTNEPVTYIGKKSAPVQIEFYAPLTLAWHRKTIGLLRDYDKKHPGKIRVSLMPMGNTDCDKVINDRGFTCAIIFVNGKHEFRLPNGKTADFQKRPNNGDSSFYNSEDVIAVLDNMNTLPAQAPFPWLPVAAAVVIVVVGAFVAVRFLPKLRRR